MGLSPPYRLWLAQFILSRSSLSLTDQEGELQHRMLRFLDGDCCRQMAESEWYVSLFPDLNFLDAKQYVPVGVLEQVHLEVAVEAAEPEADQAACSQQVHQHSRTVGTTAED